MKLDNEVIIMGGPIGNKHALGNDGGRPLEWTLEKIKDLISKLNEWVAKEDSLVLMEFCCENKVTNRQLHYLVDNNEEFREALYFTKGQLAVKLGRRLNKRQDLHPAFYHRYIRYYDHLLHEFEKECKQVESSITADQIEYKWAEDGETKE